MHPRQRKGCLILMVVLSILLCISFYSVLQISDTYEAHDEGHILWTTRHHYYSSKTEQVSKPKINKAENQDPILPKPVVSAQNEFGRELDDDPQSYQPSDYFLDPTDFMDDSESSLLPLESSMIDYGDEDMLQPEDKSNMLKVDPNGYIVHLPHSGFSNQLSELENALTLAAILNRTFILPPIYLGIRELTWAPFHKLVQSIRKVEEIFYNYTLVNGKETNALSHKQRELKKALVQGTKAIVALDDLFDITRLPRSVRTISINDFMNLNRIRSPEDVYIFRENIQYEFMYADSISGVDASKAFDNQFHEPPVTPPTFPVNYTEKKQTQYLEIVNRYSNSGQSDEAVSHSQIVSHPDKNLTDEQSFDPVTGDQTYIKRINMGRYHHVVNLEAPFIGRSKPLIVFGSTFGFNRLNLEMPENLEIKNSIRKSLIYHNPLLNFVADSILQEIGGVGIFLGVHLRVGDGYFNDAAQKTAKNIVNRIHNLLDEQKLSRPLRIFLSTDAKPEDDELLIKPIRDIADTLWTLSDFQHLLYRLNDLEDLRRPRPDIALSRVLDAANGLNVYRPLPPDFNDDFVNPSQMNSSAALSPFARIWIPFVDQMVAARGFGVIGTMYSTFSSYMERLHVDYWKRYYSPLLPATSKDGRLLGKV